MKKYGLVIFFFLLWGADAALDTLPRLIPVACFAVAFFCLTLIPRSVPAYVSGAAVALGASIYEPAFALRLLPALALLCGYREALSWIRKEKKKKGAGTGTVYTLVLVSALTAVGVLIADLDYLGRNPSRFAFERLSWVFVGAALFFALLIAAAAPKGAFPQERRYLLPVFIGAGVCFSCAAAGYLLNMQNYDFCFAAAGWLSLAAYIAGTADPVTERVFDMMKEKAERFVS